MDEKQITEMNLEEREVNDLQDYRDFIFTLDYYDIDKHLVTLTNEVIYDDEILAYLKDAVNEKASVKDIITTIEARNNERIEKYKDDDSLVAIHILTPTNIGLMTSDINETNEWLKKTIDEMRLTPDYEVEDIDEFYSKFIKSVGMDLDTHRKHIKVATKVKEDKEALEKVEKEYKEYVNTLTKLELLKTMRMLAKDTEYAYVAKELTLAAITQGQGLAMYADSFKSIESKVYDDPDNTVKPDEIVQELNTKISKNTDSEELDGTELDQLYDCVFDIDQSLRELNICTNVAHEKYEEIRVSGKTTIAEDITETLLKNRQTLEKSDSNPNAALYMKYIDSAIEELKTHSIDRMYPKMTNPKKIKKLVQEFYADPLLSLKIITSCGFMLDWIMNFTDFMITEQEFAVPEKSHSKDEFVCATCVFFYHITKIVDAEVDKHNYLSLIFKYYILQVLEVESTPKPDEESRIDENGNESEESKFRSSLYKAYMPIFDKYLKNYDIMKANKDKFAEAVSIFTAPKKKPKNPRVLKSDLENEVKVLHEAEIPIDDDVAIE